MSAPKRFLTENLIDYPAVSEVKLEGEQFNHAKNVLRLAAGAEITLLEDRKSTRLNSSHQR